LKEGKVKEYLKTDDLCSCGI